MMSIKRNLLFSLLIALLFLVSVSSVSAAPSSASVVRETVSWTIPAGQCPHLPAGVSVSGTGQRFAVTKVKVKADGSTQTTIDDLVVGNAWDSTGKRYGFLYANHSVETVPPGGSPHHIFMIDKFVLQARHSAPQLDVAFVWSWTYTPPDPLFPPVDNWKQFLTKGDPLLCDPI
jgi:hypothetical protein